MPADPWVEPLEGSERLAAALETVAPPDDPLKRVVERLRGSVAEKEAKVARLEHEKARRERTHLSVVDSTIVERPTEARDETPFERLRRVHGEMMNREMSPTLTLIRGGRDAD